MTTMKAIRIHQYGNPQVLRAEDVPRPEPGAAEILVRVVAAGVNAIDWKIRSGMLKEMIPLPLPYTPGLDFSGVVAQLGSNVGDLGVGAEVFGKVDLPAQGSYAEYVVAKRSGVVAKPRAIDHLHAAAVPLAALTAWQGLFGDARGPGLDLRAGQSVIILGAAGGVGSFAVSLAKWKGARVVAVTRKTGQDELRALGADVVVDEQHPMLGDVGQADAVFDLVGGELQRRAWAQVKQGGAFASTMGMPAETEARAHGARASAVSTQTNGEQLAEIARLIDAGKVKVLISETVPLGSAWRAHESIERGGVRGKIVLTVAQP